MNRTNLLLKTYYEALYELLDSNKAHMEAMIEKLMRDEIENRRFELSDGEKYHAYRDAAFAFLAERLETYNPIGIQYTFERIPSKFAQQLELQLNWYDSSAEFNALTEAANAKAEHNMTDRRLHQLAGRLISEVGAFPNSSIISAYQAAPALPKLPDYIVAKAIEEIITR